MKQNNTSPKGCWAKRGMLSILFLALLFNVIMGMLIIRAHMKKNLFEGKVGESAFSLLDSYQQAAAAQFFVDTAASLALPDAMAALAEQGFSFDKACGTYKTFALWQTEDRSLQECAPSLEKEIPKFLNEKIDKYFQKLLGITRLPKQNYDFIIKGKGNDQRIYGIGTLPTFISLPCQPGKVECGKLRVDLSFSQELPDTFKDYQALKDRLLLVSNSCKTRQNLPGEKDLIRCVEEKMGIQNGLLWESEIKQAPKKGANEDRTFAFLAKQISPTANQKKGLEYQMAMVIPDNAPPPAIDFLDGDASNDRMEIALQWEESSALDAAGYLVYASQSEQPISCAQMFRTDQKPPALLAPKDIPQALGSGLYELRIKVAIEKSFCFAVIAADEKANHFGVQDSAVQKIRCSVDQQAITCSKESASGATP